MLKEVPVKMHVCDYCETQANDTCTICKKDLCYDHVAQISLQSKTNGNTQEVCNNNLLCFEELVKKVKSLV